MYGDLLRLFSCLSVCLSVHLFCLSVWFVYLSVCLYFCLHLFCLSIFLSVHLFCLSVWLFSLPLCLSVHTVFLSVSLTVQSACLSYVHFLSFTPQNVDIGQILEVARKLTEAAHYESDKIEALADTVNREWKAFDMDVNQRTALLTCSLSYHKNSEEVSGRIQNSILR